MNTLPARRQSRRRFIQSTGLAATAIGFPAIISARSPNAKLNLAIIGCGGRGGSNMANTARTENVVALCDVNAHNLNRAATKHPKARTYRDFRKLYEKTGDIDAVVVFAGIQETELLNPIIEASLSPFGNAQLPVYASSKSIEYRK